jgi:osmoprotectant transport system permease protein
LLLPDFKMPLTSTASIQPRVSQPEKAAGASLARWNPALAALALLGIAACAGLAFVKVAPNRLVSGDAVAFTDVLQGPQWLIAAMLSTIALAALVPLRRAVLWTVALMSIASIVAIVWLAGAHATFVAQTASPIARTSLGGAFWTLCVLLGLSASDALQRLRVSSGRRTAVLLAALVPLYWLIASGWCNDLSVMKEYANRADTFTQAIWRHMQIVLVALVPTLLIGLPLGWLARQRADIGRALFPVLNVIQTVPSIALFGLLMAPLGLLAAAVPLLQRAGISGIGLAPGVIALTLYSLLPVVRGTLAGLQQVPSSVRDAALGMGMTPARIFTQVDVPLAAPVVLAGIRTAAIQSVGLAAVTALIGAGGLGAIMFEGLFSSAQDLVLLGVVPIIVLGVVVDAIFTALIALASRAASPGVSVTPART